MSSSVGYIPNIVYVLLLTKGKYYIGEILLTKATLYLQKEDSVKDVHALINSSVKNIPFVNNNSPYKIIKLLKNTNITTYTLEMMKHYGWNNVRGDVWIDEFLFSQPKIANEIKEMEF